MLIAAAVLAGMVFGLGVEPTPTDGRDSPRWTTVWFDDFDGTTLDQGKWKPEESCWGGGNRERQCYTGRPDNIVVKDGILKLIAKKEQFTGPLYPEGMDRPQGRKRQQYTSGKVRTLGLADWTYGRISARMKLPAGQGTWPAFWMMPTESVYGGWPLSGEIDIMEAVNLGTPCDECAAGVETRTSGALHFGGEMPDNTYWFAKANEAPAAPPDQIWRVYSVEWAQGQVQWFVDGELFLRLSQDNWYTAALPNGYRQSAAPFDRPFYLMLNLAVGGNLAEKSNGGGFDRRSFPAALEVDWVRVEQCEGDLETGRACLSGAPYEGTPEGPWETLAR